MTEGQKKRAIQTIKKTIETRHFGDQLDALIMELYSYSQGVIKIAETASVEEQEQNAIDEREVTILAVIETLKSQLNG